MSSQQSASDVLFVTMGALAGAGMALIFIVIGHLLAGGFGAH